ncbi:hypothetical protein RF11_03050 [Thelohanellus kitauei]|uniref:Uncharacterized protein n=1 Tax=Thelohanellus kitauei TaxID=669202 RepID=A0A0C2MXE1_THEKT|nr:hypothetical protein RF11_03050 [Thelohanellus kitauei]
MSIDPQINSYHTEMDDVDESSLCNNEQKDTLHTGIMTGKMYENFQRFDEAGKAYFDAAGLQENILENYSCALENYRESAKCYLNINSRKVIDCYQKIIDVMLKDEQINWGIKYCFEFGYKCGTQFGDLRKREEFYKRGEDLRSILLKTHYSDYENDLEEAFEVHDNFNVKKYCGGAHFVFYTSVCRNCIEAYESLNEFLKGLTKDQIEKNKYK